MATAVVGAGPVGAVCARALAEQGEDVLLVDPDPGPRPDGTWHRRGVMQFAHPHFFRFQVPQVMSELVPQMWAEVLASGAVVNDPPDGMPPHMTSVSTRRSTFEAALQRSSAHERVTRIVGTAEQVCSVGGRVSGLVVDGTVHHADRVVVAAGRSGALDEGRPPREGGSCGQSYVSRMYRARSGAEPLRSWSPLGAEHLDYQAIVFPQDDGTHSALVIRPSADPTLEALWEDTVYDRAAARIPVLAPWTHPDSFEPITPAMRGGTLTNSYRGQGAVVGVFHVGDAVCTTNPSGGRGVALGLQQVQSLLALIADHADPRDASGAFEQWCTAHVRPWYDDHVRNDAYLCARYAGEDLDVEATLPSAVVGAAAVALPHLEPVVGPYFAMVSPPASLTSVEQDVRTLLRTGWRPPMAEGPRATELVAEP